MVRSTGLPGQGESSQRKLLVTSATLVVTGALLVVTMFAIRNKCLTTSNNKNLIKSFGLWLRTSTKGFLGLDWLSENHGHWIHMPNQILSKKAHRLQDIYIDVYNINVCHI